MVDYRINAGRDELLFSARRAVTIVVCSVVYGSNLVLLEDPKSFDSDPRICAKMRNFTETSVEVGWPHTLQQWCVFSSRLPRSAPH